MYAILVTGGKQYRVMKGETLRVATIDGDAGSEVKFDQILMLGDGEKISLGDALKGASITATIKRHGRAEKIRIVKFRAAASTIASRWAIGRTTPKSDHRHRRWRQEVSEEQAAMAHKKLV